MRDSAQWRWDPNLGLKWQAVTLGNLGAGTRELPDFSCARTERSLRFSRVFGTAIMKGTFEILPASYYTISF